MGLLLPFAALFAAAACLAMGRRVHRHFTAPAYFYLLMASFLLACAITVSCLPAWLPAGALADVCLAFSGMALAVASRHLRYAFGLAGGGDD